MKYFNNLIYPICSSSTNDNRIGYMEKTAKRLLYTRKMRDTLHEWRTHSDMRGYTSHYMSKICKTLGAPINMRAEHIYSETFRCNFRHKELVWLYDCAIDKVQRGKNKYEWLCAVLCVIVLDSDEDN